MASAVHPVELAVGARGTLLDAQELVPGGTTIVTVNGEGSFATAALAGVAQLVQQAARGLTCG